MTGRFEADPGPFLRPYAMTEGRTEPTGPDLAIEDLVGSAGPGEPPSWLSLEHRSIATACRETLSVAELAARVDLPWGSPGSWSATWPARAWSPSTAPPATPAAPTSPCSSRSCTASSGSRPVDDRIHPPRRWATLPFGGPGAGPGR